MATKIKTKNNKVVTLLTPGEKSNKYADELKRKIHYTTDGKYKADKNGVVKSLTPTEASYRMGYLQARKDIAKVHNAKQGLRK